MRKALIATGVFAVSIATAATMTFAQTASPTNSTANTTVTPTTSTMTPSGAPATGR